MRVILFFVAAFFMLQTTVDAQTIQQPVFGVTSVSTTVSVPDRGSALLGSISRAADSRRTYGFGPFRPGSNRGSDRSHTSLSTSVFIHDLRAMDEAILNGTTDGNGAAHITGHPPLRQTDHREYSLRGLTSARRNDAVRETYSLNAQAVPPAQFTPAESTPAEPVESKADRYLRLGREAVAAGKLSVAKLHFRAAERNGSTAAVSELASLTLR